MIYIFCALYEEAKVWIEHYRLKKDVSNNYFQTFISEDICLAITKSNITYVASCVSATCVRYGISKDDYIINIGTCAKLVPNTNEKKVYLCNKITEYGSNRTFYPDILYKHNFCEEEIITGNKVYDENNELYKEIHTNDACDVSYNKDLCIKNVLYDMEAATIYQAMSCFYGPHQMIFLKIVSDYGDTYTVTKDSIDMLMRKNKESIVDFIDMLKEKREHIDKKNIYSSIKPKKLSIEQEKVVEKFCADLDCSVTMERMVRQSIKYMLLASIDFMDIIKNFYDNELVPCSRKEAKKVIEELKKYI